MTKSIIDTESHDAHISYLQEVRKSNSFFIRPLPDSTDCYERISILEKKEVIQKGSLLRKSPDAFTFLQNIPWKEKVTLLQHTCAYYSYEACANSHDSQIFYELVLAIWNECLKTEDYQDLKLAFLKYVKHQKSDKDAKNEAQEIREALEVLPVNSFYFVCRDSIVIEFQRTSTTTFTISLYAEHPVFRYDVHIYKDVHQNHIFSDELKTDFLQAILEGPSLSAFEWFPYYLDEYDCHIRRLPSPDLFEKTHRSCLKKIFINHKGEGEYRKFTLKVKLHVLIQIYRQLEGKLKENSIDGKYLRSVFHDASQNILKSLEHKLRKGSLDEKHPLVLSIRATALEILDNLEQVEKEIGKIKIDAPLRMITCYPEESANNMRKEILSEAESKIEQVIMPSFNVKEISSALVQVKSNADLKQLHGLLQKWNEYKKDHKDLVISEIECFIMQLPLPNKANLLDKPSFWDLTPSATKETLLQLHDLIILYDELIEFYVSPEEKNHFYALYAIIHHLAIRYEQKFLSGSHSLANFGIFFNGNDMTILSKMEYFHLPQDYLRREEIIEYFSNFNKDKQDESFFKLPIIVKIQEKSLLRKSEISSSPMSQYFLSLAACGKPKNALESLEKNFKTCNQVSSLADHFIHLGMLFRAAAIIHSLGKEYDARGAWNEATQSFIPKTNVGLEVHVDRKKYDTSILEIFIGFSHLIGSCWDPFTIEDYKLKKSLPSEEKYIFHSENNRNYKKTISQKHSYEVLEKEDVDSYGKSLLSANGDLDNYLYNFMHAFVKFTTSETLKDRNQQQVFEGQLFRYFITKEMTRFFPLLQSSRDQKEYVGRRLAETLYSCIVQYAFMQNNSKPDIPNLCFLVKIAVNASFYFENLSITEECIRNITIILQQNKEIQKEQKSLLYLYLIFAYSGLKRRPSSEEVETILLAWCFFKSLSIPKELEEPFVTKRAHTYIYTLLADRDLPINPSFVSRLLEDNGLPSLTNPEIKLLSSYLVASDGRNALHIQLISGTIMWNNELCRHEVIGKNISSLFSQFLSPETVYEFVGTCANFTHPQFGSMRLINTNNPGRCRLEKKQDNEWYQYVEITPSYFTPFFRGVSCWISTSCEKKKLLAIDNITGKTTLHLDEEGISVMFDEKKRVPLPVEETFFQYQNFLLDKNILLTSLKLPSGDLLSFKHADGEYRYTYNPNFVFVENSTHFLSSEKFITLKHRHSDSKKIFAFLEEISNGLSNPRHHLDFQLVEYDLKEGKIDCFTQEGVLYLSYLYLLQGEVIKAHELLANPFLKKSFSPTSLTICSWIFETKAQKAVTYAIKLSVWALYIKQPQKFSNHSELKKRMQHTYYQYKRYEASIGNQFLLPEKSLNFKEPPAREAAMMSTLSSEYLKYPHYWESVHYSPETCDLDNSKDLFNNYAFERSFRDAYDMARQGQNKQRLKLRLALRPSHPFAAILNNAIISGNNTPPYLPRSGIVNAVPPLKRSKQIDHDLLFHFVPLPVAEDRSFSASIDRSQIQQLYRLSLELPNVLTKKEPLIAFEQHFIEEERVFILDEVSKDIEALGYKKGRELLRDKKMFKLKDGPLLQSTLRNKISRLTQDLDDYEKCICEIANLLPKDIKGRLKKERGKDNELDMEKIAQLFFVGTVEAFTNANNELGASCERYEETKIISLVRHLYNHVGAYMVLDVRLKKLERAYDLLLTMDRSNNSLANKSLTQKLANELKYCSSHFDPEVYPQFLAFEYLNGLSLRPNQVALLQKFLKTNNKRYCDQIIEMMMGEGKTAVAAPLLLLMAAQPGRLDVRLPGRPFDKKNDRSTYPPGYFLVKPGRLAVFVTPASQYTTVLHNLRGSLRDLDPNRNIEELAEISRASLDEKKCKDIFEKLKDMMQKGDILIVTPEKMGKLLLCYLSLPAHEMDTPKAGYLNTIIEIFYKQADAIFDEIHISLNVDHKVNFPFGLSEKVDAKKITLTKRLFSLFMEEDISFNEKGEKINFKKVLSLHHRRDALSEQECAWIAGAVAFNILTLLPQLGWNDRQYFQPLFRYLHGTMSEKSQKQLDGFNEVLSSEEKEDYHFLQYLRDLYNSSREEERNLAESFAHLRLILQKILPPSYKKICNKHFARRKIFADSQGLYPPGAIAPLDGVGAQKESCFGFHWEDIIFHFRVALETGIDTQQLILVAENMDKDATNAMQREKIPYDKTLEAIQFYEVTSVNLYSFVTNPQKYLPTITNYLKNNLEARLKIEEETIHHVVRYYPQFITSTGHNLANMFSTVRGMTATPWNDISFADRLKKEKHYEEGIKEKIIAQYIERFADPSSNKSGWHFVPSCDPQGVLESCLKNHPAKQRVQGLIDFAGYFKDFSNEELAIIYRNYFQKPALFFTYDLSKNEKTPDSLAVMKLGSDTPFIIGGTRLADIQRAGLEVEDYVVAIDERHATGVDLPFMADAIIMITLDMSLKIGDFCQASLRLRDFFVSQSLEPVMLETYRSYFKEHSPLGMFCELMPTYEDNQEKTKKQHFNKALFHNIDDTFVQHGIDSLFNDDKSKDWENAIVCLQGDDAYISHGSIECDFPTEKVLKDYSGKKLQALAKGSQQGITKQHINQISKIDASINQKIEEAKKDKYFDPLTKKVSINLGTHIEVQNELQNELQTNVLTELDQNLLLELENKTLSSSRREEFKWKEQSIQLFFESLVSNSAHEQRLCFSQLFLPTRNFSYPHFGEIFQSQLFCTRSWAYPCLDPLPFYHNMQRPIDQLLVVKNKEESIAIAISQYEHHHFRRFLEKHAQSFPTLSLISSSADLATAPQDMHQILIEANVFNGSISFLNKYAQTTAKWLYAKKQSVRNSVIQFLKLKTYEDKFEKRNLASSYIFMTDIERIKQKMHLDKDTQFAIYSKEEIEDFTQKDKQKIVNLNSVEVNFLKPELANELLPGQIPCLVNPQIIEALILPFLIDKLQPNQMPWISDTQIPQLEGSILCTQSIPAERIEKCTDMQISYLCEQQVVKIKDKAQILRIEKIRPDLLRYIIKEQVQLVSDPFLKYLQKEEAIQAVDPSLLHLVPDRLYKYLSQDQVEKLENTTVIQKLPTDKVRWLISEKQIMALSDEQLLYLKDDQIYNYVRDVDLIGRLSDELAKWVHPDVVQHLKDEIIPLLTTEERIQGLLDDQLKLIVPEQIYTYIRSNATLMGRLSVEQIPSLHPSAIEHIPSDKLPSLTVTQIKDCPENACNRLLPGQLKLLSQRKQLEALSDKNLLELEEHQLEMLSPNFIHDRFRSIELLAKLPNTRVNEIAISAVNNLPPGKIPLLNDKAHLEALSDKNLLELEEHQLEMLSPGFIYDRFRSKELLAKLPNSRVNDVDISVVNDLPPGKIPLLTKKAHLEALSNENLLELEEHQLEMLSSQFIKRRFRSKELLAKLPNTKVDDVDPSAVNNLPQAKISYLTKKEQITALDDAHIPFVHPDICKRYGKERIKIITALVVSIIALLVSCALLSLGSIALQGGLSVFAPQFSVKIFSYLGSSLMVSSLLVAGSGTFIISLLAFVIYTSHKLSKHPSSKIKAPLRAVFVAE